MADTRRTSFERLLVLIKPSIFYLAALAVVTAVCLLVYLEVQQSLRRAADDPQTQMAEDAASALAQGRRPSFGEERIEIARSLAAYLMIFDNQGMLVSTNAVLDGHTPMLPPGVFDWVKRNGEDRISWQPRQGLRSALVVVGVPSPNGGFVAAGRSLREVERREAFAFRAAAAVWAALLVTLFLSIYAYRRASRSVAFADSNHLTTPGPAKFRPGP